MPAKQNRVEALYLRVDHILEISKKVLDLQKTWRYLRKLQRYKSLTLKSKLGDVAKVVLRKVKELYPDRIKNGKTTNLSL